MPYMYDAKFKKVNAQVLLNEMFYYVTLYNYTCHLWIILFLKYK